MIRPATPADCAAATSLAVSSGLFSAEDTAITDKMMADYFAGAAAEGHRCLIDDESEPLAVAYYAPAPATEGSWYLTMIAVQADQQGRGRGAALLRHVEAALRADGQRLLLVETSGTPDFGRTRQFYVKCGYEQEARVRDYFESGNDMVLYRKALV